MIASIRTAWSWLFVLGAMAPLTVSPTQAMDKVALRTDVFFHGQHAPFFVGIAKGFYKDENIELTVNAGTGSGTVIKLVGNKNDDFGYADGGTLVKAVSEGVPVKMVMGILQASPMVIVSLKESDAARVQGASGCDASALLWEWPRKHAAVGGRSSTASPRSAPTRRMWVLRRAGS
jgi:ABC-type nitrate/sulfonate/bicarbonate transport system substrate-binding protein